MKIVLTDADDWEGLYIDGKLILEKHRITKEDILEELGILYEEIELTPEYIEKLEDFGFLPKDVKDLNNMEFYHD